MDLGNLIPNNSEKWNIKNETLFYKKLQNLPMCQIEDNIIYIFLECSLPRITLQLIKHVNSLGLEFYLLPPSFSHPATLIDNSYVIRHYFWAYSKEEFFTGFNKVEFDLIENLVNWCEKENCISLIKENYELINNKIQKTYYDYYSNKNISDYSLEIREAFKTLYRDIQISIIL